MNLRNPLKMMKEFECLHNSKYICKLLKKKEIHSRAVWVGEGGGGILADHITLSQQGGADYLHITTCPPPPFFRPSYGPA